jgi:hypothetical protein
MNSVVVCETPKLYNGLGRDVEYTVNMSDLLVEWCKHYIFDSYSLRINFFQMKQ